MVAEILLSDTNSLDKVKSAITAIALKSKD